MNERKHKVLCVDDETNILSSLKRLLRKENYRLLTASSGSEGLDILSENEVHLVLSDQRMPAMDGTEFLAKVREEHPDVIRIILTGYTDVDTIMDSVNQGNIFKFLLKPWNDQNLKLEINRALDQYDLIQDNRGLNSKIIKQNEELKGINDNLENLVQERTMDYEIQNQALELSQNILENLSIPIIGIGADGMIVFINQAVKSLPSLGEIEIGGMIHERLFTDMEVTVSQVLETGEPRSIKGSLLSSTPYDLDFMPLSGAFRGKGVVLTLRAHTQQ
jgi:FixJ family two-component response regulator